jgi:tRNA(Ile)-lysidine synthase
MDKNIKSFIEKYRLEKEKSIVLAVSGGPDSVVLLNLFLKHFPKEKIIVAHANHGLRVESRWDESFVKGLTEEFSLSYECARLKLKTSSEAEAREARYEFLRRVAAENGGKYIICGHHLNDQAETILMALTRGAGPLAVWGMNEQEGMILRPLLNTTKKEIVDYAKANHLRYHIDRSNYDNRYARNRIRAKVVPQLSKLNPNFLQTLNRNAQIGQQMAQAWDVVIESKLKANKDPKALELSKINKEPLFIQKELIKRRLEEIQLKKDGYTADNIEKVLSLLDLTRGKKVELGSLVVSKGVGRITFGKKKTQKEHTAVKLELDKPISFGGFVLKMTKDSGKAAKNNILLPSSIGYNLNIRAWKDGDKIKTKVGTKKLQDIFSDAKILAPERRAWPVVVKGQKVLWVPGLAASEQALNISKTKVIKIGVRSERKK